MAVRCAHRRVRSRDQGSGGTINFRLFKILMTGSRRRPNLRPGELINYKPNTDAYTSGTVPREGTYGKVVRGDRYILMFYYK